MAALAVEIAQRRGAIQTTSLPQPPNPQAGAQPPAVHVGAAFHSSVSVASTSMEGLNSGASQPHDLHVGTVFQGSVSSVCSAGAFIDGPNGLSAFIRPREISRSLVLLWQGSVEHQEQTRYALLGADAGAGVVREPATIMTTSQVLHALMPRGRRVFVEISPIEGDKVQLAMRNLDQTSGTRLPAPRAMPTGGETVVAVVAHSDERGFALVELPDFIQETARDGVASSFQTACGFLHEKDQYLAGRRLRQGDVLHVTVKTPLEVQVGANGRRRVQVQAGAPHPAQQKLLEKRERQQKKREQKQKKQAKAASMKPQRPVGIAKKGRTAGRASSKPPLRGITNKAATCNWCGDGGELYRYPGCDGYRGCAACISRKCGIDVEDDFGYGDSASERGFGGSDSGVEEEMWAQGVRPYDDDYSAVYDVLFGGY